MDADGPAAMLVTTMDDVVQSSYRRVRDFRAFTVAPREDLVMVSRSFAFWQSSGGVHGTLVWGRPDEQDVAAMGACWNAFITSQSSPDPNLIDFRTLEAVDLLAFKRFVQTFVENNARWRALAGLQAMLHSDGIASATALGALKLAATVYDLRTFDRAGAAFAWIGRPELEREYEELRAEILDPPDIVRRVRAVLEAEDHAGPTAEDLARGLGLSSRSLQRRLADAGTTLHAVRVAHVVERVERLLEGTELDLGAIARMVGIGSASRLIELFRRMRGTTPGAFRASRTQRTAAR